MLKPEKSRKKLTNAMLALTTMAAMGGGFQNLDSSINLKPSNKMPLTDEETETLASLSGKEKKKYVKELKTKYSR